MVLHHTDKSIISHPFDQVTQAHTLRYPNPFSPHVISSDTLERGWDEEGKKLRWTRLLLKRGTLPNWAPRGIVSKSETWVLERSELDLLNGSLDVISRNLDHRIVMEVIETFSLRARGEVCDATTSVQVTSSWGFHLIRKRIEQYGVSRFQRQTKTARLGLEMTIQILRPESNLRDRLLNGEKLKYPAVGPSSAVLARLHSLRERTQRNKQRISALLLGDPEPGGDPTREESITKEEEDELDQLEIEYGSEPDHRSDQMSEPSEIFEVRPTTYVIEKPRRRWFWWWRWHLGCSTPLESKSDEHFRATSGQTGVSSTAGRC